MLQDLGRLGIQTLTGTKVEKITPEGIVVEQAGEKKEFFADTIVLAVGSVSNSELESIISGLDIPFHVIGDARTVATAFDAIHSGYKAGIDISTSK